MTPPPESSLTGSSHGAPATHAPPVSLALGRLRFSVLLSCWVIGLALLAQTVIWGLTTFTQVRWDRTETATPEAAVVVTAAPAPATRSALDAVRTDTNAESVDTNRILTGYDRVFQISTRLSRGLGTLGLIALLPLLAVGVLLAAASATRGVDKTVSAFTWSIVVAMLVLPLGEVIGLSESGGAFWSYEQLTAQVDAAQALSLNEVGSVNEGRMGMIARYLLLPLAALCAVGMVGLRFDAGVEAGLVKKEELALDPTLEIEAGNITPASLHGGRTGAAMQAMGAAVPFGVGSKAVPALPDGPASIRQVSPGDAPKRMI